MLEFRSVLAPIVAWCAAFESGKHSVEIRQRPKAVGVANVGDCLIAFDELATNVPDAQLMHVIDKTLPGHLPEIPGKCSGIH